MVVTTSVQQFLIAFLLCSIIALILVHFSKTKKLSYLFLSVCLGGIVLAIIFEAINNSSFATALGSSATVAAAMLAGVMIYENRRLQKSQSDKDSLEKILQWVDDIESLRSTPPPRGPIIHTEDEVAPYIKLLAKSELVRSVAEKSFSGALLPEVDSVIKCLVESASCKFNQGNMYYFRDRIRGKALEYLQGIEGVIRISSEKEKSLADATNKLLSKIGETISNS